MFGFGGFVDLFVYCCLLLFDYLDFGLFILFDQCCFCNSVVC